MTSSISVEPYETVEFPDSDTDSWQVVDPFDSENDDVITTESDVISSDDEEDEDEDDVDVEEEEEDGDVVVDDVIPSESDVISSEYDEDEDEDEDDDDEDDEDDVISSDEDEEEEEEEEEDEDDVITSEDEEEEDDEDDVITPMSSDEMTNHTQELNKVYKLDRLINGERDSYSDAEDAYVDRMRLEHMLYEEAMKEDAYIKRMQLEEEEHDEDEDEDDYDEDLDDELIPRWLNNKFERQRMRKLGKKVYPKMKKSKRMVNQYNRPGCAGAKHGLGLKHNLIG